MTHEKLVAGTESPTRYTKIIRNPGAGTKYNRTYQETGYVSRYTKLVAGGKDYVPPAPPEPEYEELKVVTGCKNAADNVYQIGNMVAFTTATYSGGSDSNQYRWRFQERDKGDGSWVNGVWTVYDNTAISIVKDLRKGGQLRFQCQARDTSQDPVAQVNSFGPVANVPFPELKCEKAPIISGQLYRGETLHCTKAVYSGGVPPVIVESQIQRSDTGDNGTWSGVDAWGQEANGTHQIGKDETGKYFRVSGRAIDSSDDSVSKAETSQSFSDVVGPVQEYSFGDCVLTNTSTENNIEHGDLEFIIQGASVTYVADYTGDMPHDHAVWEWKVRSGNATIRGASDQPYCTFELPTEYPGGCSLSCSIYGQGVGRYTDDNTGILWNITYTE